MLYLSKTIFAYRFYKILVIEPTTGVKAESIGAPSVKEIELQRKSDLKKMKKSGRINLSSFLV
jgi:hypothetical protein